MQSVEWTSRSQQINGELPRGGNERRLGRSTDDAPDIWKNDKTHGQRSLSSPITTSRGPRAPQAVTYSGCAGCSWEELNTKT